jgi:hypothetical protein
MSNVLKELIREVVRDELAKKYSNIPSYVFTDLYRGSDEKFFAQLNRLTWKLQVLEVNPSDFAPETQVRFNERKFGAMNPHGVPDDEQRMQFQARLAKNTQPGHNEPVIVIKAVDGYRLWEGWHRTMNILKLGDNGGPPGAWDRVKINAWVGSRTS